MKKVLVDFQIYISVPLIEEIKKMIFYHAVTNNSSQSIAM